ncbi:MAG TPA: GNAT family N-acetyltransferase [Pyrinomonadaceae bacterium]|jgi:GNAT superfamily N-acetyltransferase
MAAVRYRPVGEAEIPETVEVFLRTLADVYARHNMASPLPGREFVETHYRHIYSTGIFQVAEVEGRIGTICHAVVRGPLWFLSGFWTLPELQGQRIGGTLLRRVWEEGRVAGALKFFTWSSIDLQAMATYMKMELLPGYQILSFGGAMRELPARADGCEVEPLSLSNAMALDAQLRETSREADHRFWLTKSGHEGRQVLRDGRMIGYYYLNSGAVGPAGWANPQEAGALLATAFRGAAEQSGQVRLAIPGVNHTALRLALKAGLRLTGYTHLLTTAPFGQMEQYIPSGPSLF